MGRKSKQGLEYYPMDVDFFQDIKIRKLIKRQSGKAVSVYTLLLCLIYKGGYYIQWDKELPFIISEQTGFDEAYIQEVLECCLTLGLFDKSLYAQHKVLSSVAIQERYNDICTKSRRKDTIQEYNLIEQQPTQKTKKATKAQTKPTKAIQKKAEPKPKTQTKQEHKQAEEKKDTDTISQLKTSEIWLEQMSIRFKLDKQDIIQRIDQFRLDCHCRDKLHESLTDAKRHFNDWLRINLNVEKSERKTSQRQSSSTVLRQEQMDYSKEEKW